MADPAHHSCWSKSRISPGRLTTWHRQRPKPPWAPDYVHHRTLTGLTRMVTLADNGSTPRTADGFAAWFERSAGGFVRKQMNDIPDVETGGMHANTTISQAHGAARSYAVTGDLQRRAGVEANCACGSYHSAPSWTSPTHRIPPIIPNPRP